MSLLQDVLRTQTIESLDKALASGRNSPDDDEELVNVVSALLCLQCTAWVCSYDGLLHTNLDVSPGQSWQVKTWLAASISPSFAYSGFKA